MSEQLVKSIKRLEDKLRKLQGVDGRFFYKLWEMLSKKL